MGIYRVIYRIVTFLVSLVPLLHPAILGGFFYALKSWEFMRLFI